MTVAPALWRLAAKTSPHEAVRFETLLTATATGAAANYKAFADQCLSEYDIDGWKAPDLINPDDVNVIWKRHRDRR